MNVIEMEMTELKVWLAELHSPPAQVFKATQSEARYTPRLF